MNIVGAIAAILNSLLLLFVSCCWCGCAGWIPFFNREWRPKGAGLVAAEVVYTVTDPPIKLFRRFIPPLRVGAIAHRLRLHTDDAAVLRPPGGHARIHALTARPLRPLDTLSEPRLCLPGTTAGHRRSGPRHRPATRALERGTTMALTPDDVVTKQFQHVRFKEGFDPDEVDDFLDEIVVEWRKTIAENDELKAKLAAVRVRLQRPLPRRPPKIVAEAPAPVPPRRSPTRPGRRGAPRPRAPASSSSPSACTTSTSQRASPSATSSSPTRSPRPLASSPKPRRRVAKKSPASTSERAQPREPHHRAAQVRARLPRAAAQVHRGQAARPRDHWRRRRVRPRCRPSASRPAFDRPSPPA